MSLKDALLSGYANAFSAIRAILAYLAPQTRIGTATDGFLDLIAQDYFGALLVRGSNQSDASFRANILANLTRRRGTRASVAHILEQLTGIVPIIIEPQRPLDCGAYGVAALCGYGVAGYYGSISIPYQSFVISYRPQGSGIPNVAGYGISTAGYGRASQAEYASRSFIQNFLTDADLFSAVNSVRPIGYTIWMRINTAPAVAGVLVGGGVVSGALLSDADVALLADNDTPLQVD